MAAKIDLPMICPVLVGRAPQVALLDRFLDDLPRGEASTILIAGEAGIGKSRLVREAQLRAAQCNIAALTGQCFEPDRSLPFGPIIDLLSAYCASQRSETLAVEMGPLGPALLAVAPSLATFLPDVQPARPLEPDQERRRAFAAIAQLLSGIAARQPLLLVFEDMHWADEASLEFLPFMVRGMTAQPIGMLLTYRSDEISPGLAHALAALDRARVAVEMPLTGLDEVEVDQMLQAIFRLEKAPRAEFRSAVTGLSGGNPFFIEELLRSLVTQGDLYVSGGTWSQSALATVRIPRSVQDAVQRRRNELSEAAERLLEVAAVIGQRFEFGLLPRLTGLDDQATLTCLKELISAQLVVELSGDQFGFRHALTRESVYGALLTRERTALHRQVANVIDEMGNADSSLQDLAYQYYAGAVWDKAFEYCRRAGERALGLYAPRAAAEHLTHALEAATALKAAPDPSLRRALGRAHEMLGEWEAARTDYEAARRAALQAGDQRAIWESVLDLGMLWAVRDYDRTGDCYREALELAHKIGEPRLIAHSLNRLGNWHLNRDEPQIALEWHKEALGIFEESGDERGIAATLDFMGMTTCLSADLVRAREYYGRAVAALREVGDRAGLSSALATLTLCAATPQTDSMAMPAGTLADAILAGEEALAEARAIEQRSGEAFALAILSMAYSGAGFYDRALASAEEALQVAEEIGHSQWTSAAEVALGVLELEMLDGSDACKHLERAYALAREIKSGHWIHCSAGFLIRACIAIRDYERATAVIAGLPDAAGPPGTMGLHLLSCGRIELALALGDHEQAMTLVDELQSCTPNLAGNPGAAPRLSLLRADTLAALGFNDTTEAELAAARIVAQTQGARSLLWRIDLALGRTLTACGRSEGAAEVLAEAQATLDALTAGISDPTRREAFATRTKGLLPAAAGPRGAAGGRPTMRSELTPREREVAVLVTIGKSNRDIAAVLYVGERTVETHVSHILGKLGMENRAQIAAWAATHLG